jgi:hypothetical protein
MDAAIRGFGPGAGGSPRASPLSSTSRRGTVLSETATEGQILLESATAKLLFLLPPFADRPPSGR